MGEGGTMGRKLFMLRRCKSVSGADMNPGWLDGDDDDDDDSGRDGEEEGEGEGEGAKEEKTRQQEEQQINPPEQPHDPYRPARTSSTSYVIVFSDVMTCQLGDVIGYVMTNSQCKRLPRE
ncbi:hypothetical protein SK128_021421 [Halocaridina rubra]|uniref:Uncharacterized protein n=1 Tax=Halocaridina rubra TaxID=373956 RepID=A0AAN8WX10_HALRR